MEGFTPGSALAGGALIGAAASLLLLLNGRVAGISGIVAALLSPVRGEIAWRLAFVAGLLGGGLLLAFAWPAAFASAAERSPGMLVLAGLLVGYGTRLGSGCTSGHGVCGIGRLSPRSLVATVVFMATGIAAVYLSRLVAEVA